MIVSHDMDFVTDCCDRVALMKGGKVIALGDPKEVVANLTEADLVGDPGPVTCGVNP